MKKNYLKPETEQILLTSLWGLCEVSPGEGGKSDPDPKDWPTGAPGRKNVF